MMTTQQESAMGVFVILSVILAQKSKIKVKTYTVPADKGKELKTSGKD